MRTRTSRTFVGDFETTVYDGQTDTEVWASAVVEIGTEDVFIFGSIESTFEYLKALDVNVIIYYHNLKFDGSFWLSYLITELHMKQAYDQFDDEGKCIKWQDDKDMKNNSFKYSISKMGQWYTIKIKVKGKFIEIRDSVKLLPFKVEEIGESFKTKHRKLSMEYKGVRHANCYISPEEKEYIKNDVLVVKEALEIMFENGHTSLTIGSCCLKEYKRFVGKYDWDVMFPDMYEIPLDENLYGSPNVGEYIRKSYKGGWCYVVPEKSQKRIENGITIDVNSLYPSVMSGESGCKYPTGKPKFWKGNYIPEVALRDNIYFFVRIRTRFYIKEGKLPFIQLKYDARYDETEMLKTSDVYYKGQYYRYTKTSDGELRDTIQTLTLTMTDYYLLLDHYELVDFEILDGCMFYARVGIFDEYINKYKEQKLKSKGALRTLAKLFLNNLYGKMASNTDSSFKVAFEKEDHSLGFHYIREHEKKAGYIPVGSAVTSHARNFTIRAAQLNYYGENNRGFIYADTDSIHCDLSVDELRGVTLHDKNFCCWKPEASWDEAIFTRQKTYIEHVTHENLEKIDKPYYNIKCAGMPEKCKNLFNLSMCGFTDDDVKGLKEDEIKFIEEHRTLEDFQIGLAVPGKLTPKRIKGGIVLVDTPYEIRE